MMLRLTGFGIRNGLQGWVLLAGGATLSLLLLSGCGGSGAPQASKPGKAERTTTTAAQPSAAASVAATGERAREGDGKALAELFEKLRVKEGEAVKPLSTTEAVEWVEVAESLRAAYGRSGAQGRATILQVVGGILGRFAVEGTPAGWAKVLSPSYDMMTAGLADVEVLVRKVALDQVAELWGWSPGCTMTPAEEDNLARCKQRYHELSVERLGDKEAVVRMAAVACLGMLPIDEKAAPAIAGLKDPEFSVRFQTLTSFAGRPVLMTEESILPLLHDPVPDLQGLAQRVLEARGLSPDLIGLGRMVSHERAEMRASAITLLEGHEDIDPVVWLLRLSEDPDAGVRLKAVKAFEGKMTPEVTQRLREIVAADDSAEVRAAAEKLCLLTRRRRFPPLPGSPSLNAKAN